MSEPSESAFNTLLPAARVSLFALDQDLKEVVQSLSEDWRFARVTFDIRDGDVETATNLYQKHESPNLMIVQTAEIGEGFTDKLEVLAGSCSENTAAVVVGPVNDVYLYRKLIDMGVTDYLVRPVEKQVLTNLIAKTLIEKLGAPGSKLIAFIGAKGGVGTSTLAQMSALVSSDRLGQKTIIMDAAGGRSYLSVAMGTEAMTTLHEAVRASGSADQDSFKRMMVKVSDQLYVLATGAEAVLDDSVSSDQYESILGRLMVTYPVVFVDLSNAPVALARPVLSRAHDVVIVTNPTLPSLRTARSLLQEIKTLRGGGEQGLHMALNMKGVTQGSEVSDADIETAMKMAPHLSLPWSPKVFGEAESFGKFLTDIPGAKDILASVSKFLVSFIGMSGEADIAPQSEGSQKLLGGLLGKLKSK